MRRLPLSVVAVLVFAAPAAAHDFTDPRNPVELGHHDPQAILR